MAVLKTKVRISRPIHVKDDQTIEVVFENGDILGTTLNKDCSFEQFLECMLNLDLQVKAKVAREQGA